MEWTRRNYQRTYLIEVLFSKLFLCADVCRCTSMQVSFSRPAHIASCPLPHLFKQDLSLPCFPQISKSFHISLFTLLHIQFMVSFLLIVIAYIYVFAYISKYNVLSLYNNTYMLIFRINHLASLRSIASQM